MVVFLDLTLDQALGLSTARGPLHAALAGLLALVCVYRAATGRLFAMARTGGPVPLWFGRLVFLAMGVSSAWMAWSALR